MITAIEALLGGIMLDFTSCSASDCLHLDGAGGFALLLHSVHRCLLCSHEFAAIENVQGNLLAE